MQAGGDRRDHPRPSARQASLAAIGRVVARDPDVGNGAPIIDIAAKAYALLDARRVALPITMGLTGHADVHAVTDMEIEGFLAHLIDAQRDRQLLVYTRLKRGKLDALEAWCKHSSISGMILDLTTHRNQTDDDIRGAIAELAPREWIYRSTHNDRQAANRIVRRLYGL